MMKLCSLAPYQGKSICVALSGGRDSVALLHALMQECSTYALTLSAVTCEHQIRGEASQRDLKFVQSLCREWGIPLRIFTRNVPAFAQEQKIGVEEAGRIFRYECFETLLQEGIDYIATAHHRDDYAETVLFRLLRGTSLNGLNVFSTREKIIRPLLGVSRAEITSYVQERSLPFVEDESNLDTAYTRNFLRHEVFPLLDRIEGSAEHLVEFAERASEDDAFLQSLAQEAMQGKKGVPIALPDPIFRRACLLKLKEMGVVKDYTATHLNDLAKLRNLQSGKRLSMPRAIEAERRGEEIVFYLPKPPLKVEIPYMVGTFELGKYSVTVSEQAQKTALRCDLGAISSDCVIRTRREGDVFTPFGGKSKTLKKFLNDRKIPASVGKQLPLIAKGNTVYAIFGVEISERLRVTERTKREGYLVIEEK